MQVHEIGTGLWRWTAPHPSWTPSDVGPDGWEQEVGCYLYDPVLEGGREPLAAALDA